MFVKSYLSFCVVMLLVQESSLCPLIQINTERGADFDGYPEITTILQSDNVHEIFENFTQFLLDEQVERLNIQEIIEKVTNVVLDKQEKNFRDFVNIHEQSEKPRDCQDIRKLALTPSGDFTIYPSKDQEVSVYCDMGNGAWTVIQKRIDGREKFTRDWASYRDGFGSADHEYWLGNQYIHQLTSSAQYQLRIDMRDQTGQSKHVIYDNFSISDEKSGFRLNISGFHGYNNIKDDLEYHNGMKFSTIDRDEDTWSGGSCSESWRGGWWYNNCHYVNINGEYSPAKNGKGLHWNSWTGFDESLSQVEMKIRRLIRD